MTSPKHLRIGVFIPKGCQLLDMSPIDLLGMLSPTYLTACSLPAPLIALGTPSTIHYISLPSAGPHIELTASAFLRISKTILDPEVQPGKLDILLIPGPDPKEVFDEDTKAFVRGHVEWEGEGGQKTDILCVCTGVFVLAQSGVLEGKRASGPRALVPSLKKRFGGTRWVDDRRWVRDGNIWTSGEFVSTCIMPSILCMWSRLVLQFLLRDRKTDRGKAASRTARRW